MKIVHTGTKFNQEKNGRTPKQNMYPIQGFESFSEKAFKCVFSYNHPGVAKTSYYAYFVPKSVIQIMDHGTGLTIKIPEYLDVKVFEIEADHYVGIVQKTQKLIDAAVN